MKFWEMKNLNDSEAELIFYGEIQDSKPWWRDGNYITSESFMKDIKGLKNKTNVTIHLNSGGGDVFTAIAIYTQLKTLSAKKTIIIDGIAASAATIIAMAGDVIKMPANAMMMIHNPSVIVYDMFSAEQLGQLKNSLEVCKQSIIEAYKSRTELSDLELSKMMDDETWMTGREAVANGFADEIMFEENPINLKMSNNGRIAFVNNMQFDFSKYKNAPVLKDVLEIENNVENGGNKIMDIEELKVKYPDLYNSIINQGVLEGEEQERKRLQDIDSIANTISPEILNKARYETPISAKDLAFENAVLRRFLFL